MKTCGECAWFMAEFRIEKDGTETPLAGGVCRRVSWSDGDNGPQSGWLPAKQRSCPAFEPIAVEGQPNG